MDELSERLVVAFMLALVVLIFVGLLSMIVEKAVSGKTNEAHPESRGRSRSAEGFQKPRLSAATARSTRRWTSQIL
jgi:hypothetical protein